MLLYIQCKDKTDATTPHTDAELEDGFRGHASVPVSVVPLLLLLLLLPRLPLLVGPIPSSSLLRRPLFLLLLLLLVLSGGRLAILLLRREWVALGAAALLRHAACARGAQISGRWDVRRLRTTRERKTDAPATGNRPLL
jgi:hypothetical protein